MEMVLRSSFINKLRYGLIAPPLSFSLSRAGRFFHTISPLPLPPFMIEAPYMRGVRRGYDAKEDDANLYYRFDMPGMSEKILHVTMDKNNFTNPPLHYLTMLGKKENELGEKDLVGVGSRGYAMRHSLSPNLFNTDEVMWVISNGVLRILVPKLVREENCSGPFGVRDVIQRISIERETKWREWYAKEEEGKGLAIRIDMPGLDEDYIKVSPQDDNILVIEGHGDMESKFEGFGRRHIRCKLDITKFSKTGFTISMDNGVFILTIPPKYIVVVERE